MTSKLARMSTEGDFDMLIVAVTNNDTILLKRLLQSHTFDSEELGEALEIAATHPKSIQTMKLLAEKGAPVESATIRSAVLAADPENTLFLIKQGSLPTPELLADAVATRKADIVKVLLSNGADPNIRFEGVLPIEYAVKDNQWHLVKILKKYTNPQFVHAKVIKKINKHYKQADMTGVPKPTPSPLPVVLDQHIPQTVFNTFDEKVQTAFEDLLRYPNHQIKLLAKNMQIKDRNKLHNELCREIARKIIFVHSDTLPSDDLAKCSRYTKKLSSEDLNNVRKTVYKEFIKYKDSVTEISSNDLLKLLLRYDELCFGGDVKKYMNDVKYTLQFKTSGEETFTTEGICTHKVCDYTITIPTAYFKNVRGLTNVAGHMCKDQLECLLRVMEHELVHLIIFMFCGDLFVTEQHGPLFMTMVKDLFGHTDHRHYIF